MKRSIAILYLTLAAFLGSAEVSFALPECPGTYNKATWSNCTGSTILPEGTTPANTGDHYRGAWVNGKPEGHGVLTGKKNEKFKYIGAFKEGGAHGIGTFTGATGTTYVGEWKGDKRHGQGTTTFADGARYVGEWKDNRRVRSSELVSAETQYRKLKKEGKNADAVPFAETVVQLAQKEFGPDHPSTATSLNNLAALYKAQSRHADAEPLYKRALAITEKALGPDHPSTAISLNNLAEHYRIQGRYADAEPLYKRALVIREKALGPDHPSTATSLSNLALIYKAQGRYADAEPLYRRGLAIYEKVLGLDHPWSATALNNLASLYDTQGRYADAEPLYKRSLAIKEKALGPDHPSTATSLNNLAYLYYSQGRYADAEPLFKRALAIREKALGPDHPETATSLRNLAGLYRAQGRYADAEPLFKRALAIDEKALGPEHPSTAISLNNLAALYKAQGRHTDAEPLFKRALAINEKALGPDHPWSATALNNLAALYQAQGSYADAEPLFKRALAIREKALGPDHPGVATSLGSLASLYDTQGRYADAEPLYKRSLSIMEKVLGPHHPDFAISLNLLGLLYENQGRYAEAEPLFKRSLVIREKALGPDHPSTAISLNNLALIYNAQSRYAEAEPLYKRSLAIKEKALGPDHPSTATSLSNLAGLYNTQGRYADALGYIRQSTSILRHRGIEGSKTKSLGAESERKGNQSFFRKHSIIAYKLSQLEPSKSLALQGEAFEVIQLAQTSSAASALSQMAARLGAGGTAIAGTVRRQQDLLGEWRSLDKKLIAELSAPKTKRSPEREGQLRADIRKADARLSTLDKQLAENFPQYVELANPQPLRVKAVQNLLGNDEAMVVYNRNFAWVIWRGGFRMVKLDIKPSELTAMVSKLRTSFTLKDGGLAVFPHKTAHDLYRKIFAPIEEYLEGIRHVMVVPDGALTSLPLSVLVSSPYEDSGKPAWLAERYAFTTLPSVSSLRALRVLAKKAGAGTDPFTGFGDPVLEGDPSDRRGISIFPIFSKGDKADASELRKLAALPETADELRVIARSLGASNDNVYLGENATETQVKSLDLSNTEVLAFATHGLIAGELGGLVEPGLVLTPPATASRDDDGVLTASEVAQLKLHPGLVILSACNTASADGRPGAEGLSGLAKAFFYAGSQSLLVSHWSVPSEAAKRLTTSMFANLRKVPGIGRSEALRRSMMALAANDDFSHPIYWAPFTIVGEGGVSR